MAGRQYNNWRGGRGNRGRPNFMERRHEERGPANIAIRNFKPVVDDDNDEENTFRNRSRSPVNRNSLKSKFQAIDEDDLRNVIGQRETRETRDTRETRETRETRNQSNFVEKPILLHERFFALLPQREQMTFNSPEVIMIGLERSIKGREPHKYRREYIADDVIVPRPKNSQPLCERPEFTPVIKDNRRTVRVKVDRNGRDVMNSNDFKDDTGSLANFTVIVKGGRRLDKDRMARNTDSRTETKSDIRTVRRRNDSDRGRNRSPDRRRSPERRRSPGGHKLSGRNRRTSYKDDDEEDNKVSMICSVINKSVHERLGTRDLTSSRSTELPDFSRRENRFEYTEPADPTVIPKGNRYYEHDNRDAQYSRRGNRFDRSYNSNKRREFDGAWKHDKFEEVNNSDDITIDNNNEGMEISMEIS